MTNYCVTLEEWTELSPDEREALIFEHEVVLVMLGERYEDAGFVEFDMNTPRTVH